MYKKERDKSLLEFAGKWVGSKEETAGIFDDILKHRRLTEMRRFDL